MTRTAASTSTSRSRSRSRWVTIGWVLAVLSTAITGLVVGYGVLWFQLGSGPVVEDYQVSAGGYGAAAALLLVAVPAMLAARRRRLATGTMLVAALYVGLAWASWQAQFDATEHGLPGDDAWDGIGGVLLSPTTWPLLLLALRAPYRLLRGHRDAGSARMHRPMRPSVTDRGVTAATPCHRHDGPRPRGRGGPDNR